MARTHSPHCAVRPWLLGLAGFTLLTWAAHGQYDPDWARHFSIGAVVGLNIKADFKVSGGQFNIEKQPGEYDDGFVHPSQNVDGFTANWGYKNASQYIAASKTLLMHDTTSFSTPGSSGREDASALPGFELTYGGNFWYWKRLRIGWDLGFSLLSVSITGNESMSGTASQSIYSFENAKGIELPQAPYNGSASVNGPSILSTPTLAGVSNNAPATITGSHTLDALFYTVRLGPSVYWDFNRYVGMSIGAGPAVGIVSGDLKFDQTITVNGVRAPHKGQVGGTDVVYGGYVSARILWHVMQNGDIYVGAQYMPMEDATIGAGGSQSRLHLGRALYVSAGINWPF